MQTLHSIQEERKKWLQWKNIAPLRALLETLPACEAKLDVECAVRIEVPYMTVEVQEAVYDAAWAMRPWRKGPFEVCGTFIDSEWRSNIKFDLIKDSVDLKDKTVADIGCNNGYYMFRMLHYKPRALVGFDPSPLFMTQFELINHFVQGPIVYELLGVEHFGLYPTKFDVAFCLGVLYHRSDPISTLKSIRSGLVKGGTLVLDTFMIDGDADIVLTPKDRYAKIPNIYFVPTVCALKNWCHRAGFVDMEVIAITPTLQEEQRKTAWIEGESLDTFLDPNDASITVEGYPAPKRVYMKMRAKE